MRVKLGALGNATRQFSKGEPYLRQALANYERDPAKLNEVASTSQHLANALKGQGRFDEAVTAQSRAISIMEGVTPRNYREIALAYRGIGQIRTEQKRPADADAAYEAALKAARELGDAAYIVSVVILTQAMDQLKQGKLQSARSKALEALALREAAFSADDFRAGEVHVALGQIAVAAKDRQEADRQFGIILESYARKPTREWVPWVAEASRRVALSLRDAKRHAEAEKMILANIAVRETAMPNDIGDTAAGYQILALSYADQGKFDEA